MASEREQLAAIAAVADRLDRTLDDLFAAVAELKANLGLPGAPRKEAITVAEPQPPQGALAAAGRLSDALEAMSADLKAVTGRLGTTEQRVKRGRRIITGLVVSLVLDVALTIGITFASLAAHTASDRANATVAELHSSQVLGCGLGNQMRAAQVMLWTKLAAESTPAPGSTPAQVNKGRQEIAALLAYIRREFAQLDCKKLYHL